MVPEAVLTTLAQQAPFALILGGANLLALYALLRHLRNEREAGNEERKASAEERARITDQFMGFLREGKKEAEARSAEDRAVIGANTRVMERVLVALEQSEERDAEWRDRRQPHDRRADPPQRPALKP